MLAKISPKGLFRTVKTVCGWKHSQLQCKDNIGVFSLLQEEGRGQ
jgi:hypothetical protein